MTTPLPQTKERKPKAKPKSQIKFATELSILEKTFAGAIQFLKSTQTHPNHLGKPLFDLPWFLVLGGPQTGKSSLLAHSSLNFILTKKSTSPNHIIPTTRHCDLWVSREAVFFDTSGQFTLHDSMSQGSAQLWEHFLELLFKEKKEPIQGIILTLSLERLALQSKEEQSWHFQNLSARLEELRVKQTHLAPIYLVLTKADCLAGFSEYFDDLSPEEREQTWGMSFSEDELMTAQTLNDSFTLKFNALIKNLNELLMIRLHSERDWQRRSSIKDFPLQIDSLKKTLSYFLHTQVDHFTADSRFVLRGLYFTSAVPEEHVIDRLLKPLSQGFALTPYTRPLLSPQRQAREPFFIKQLFRKVIFADQKTFSTAPKTSRLNRHLWQRRSILAGAALLIVATVIYWGHSINQNINQVAVAEKALTRYQFLATTPGKTLTSEQSFTRLQSLIEMKNAIQKTQNSHFFAWTSKQKQLALQQKTIFTEGLQTILASQLEQVLTQQLKNPHPSSEMIYGALNTYQILAQAQVKDMNLAKAWFIHYWDTKFHPSQNDLQALQRELASLSVLPAANLSLTLLQKADDYLNAQSPAVLANVLLNEHYALKQNPLSLNLASQNTLLQFKNARATFNIPAQFTAAQFNMIYEHGLAEQLAQLRKGDSVLNAQAFNQEETLQAARENYMANYIQHWQALQASLRLQDSTNLQKLSLTLDALLDPHSALFNLNQQFNANTQIKYQGMPTPISLAFSTPLLTDLQTLNPQAYQELNRLKHLVNTVNTASQPEEKAFTLAKYRMEHLNESDVLSDLLDKSATLPAPWQNWTERLVANTWQGLLQKAAGPIAKAWENQLYPEYAQKIASRFPFGSDPKNSLSLDEFSAFFAPKGTLNRFDNQYLDPFIDKSDPRQWKIKTRDGYGLALSTQSLEALRQARLLQNLFFADDASLFNLQLALTPAALSPEIKTLTLTVNGQSTVYDHQKPTPLPLTWPKISGEDPHLSFTILDQQGQSQTLKVQGPWAFVELLNQAALKPSRDPAEIAFNFPSSGLNSNAYTLSSLSTSINPFVPGLLQNLVLPKTIEG